MSQVRVDVVSTDDVLPILLAESWLLRRTWSSAFNRHRPPKHSRWRGTDRRTPGLDGTRLEPSDAAMQTVLISKEGDYLQIRMPCDPHFCLEIPIDQLRVVADQEITVVTLKDAWQRVCQLVLAKRVERTDHTLAELQQRAAERKDQAQRARIDAHREAVTAFLHRMVGQEPAVLIDVVPLFDNDDTAVVIGLLVKFSNGHAIMISGLDFQINGNNLNKMSFPAAKATDAGTAN